MAGMGAREEEGASESGGFCEANKQQQCCVGGMYAALTHTRAWEPGVCEQRFRRREAALHGREGVARHPLFLAPDQHGGPFVSLPCSPPPGTAATAAVLRPPHTPRRRVIKPGVGIRAFMRQRARKRIPRALPRRVKSALRAQPPTAAAQKDRPRRAPDHPGGFFRRAPATPDVRSCDEAWRGIPVPASRSRGITRAYG